MREWSNNIKTYTVGQMCQYSIITGFSTRIGASIPDYFHIPKMNH